MESITLNADLGEGEPVSLTEKMIQTIDAANIACGGHAGNEDSMLYCLKLCNHYNTLPGAPPGIAGAFGRGEDLPHAQDFLKLLQGQWETIDQIAKSLGIPLHHIKLHGSLYLAVERNQELADVYLSFVKSLPSPPTIFCLAGGALADSARALQLMVWEEGFPDRHYLDNGFLAPRSQTDASITNPQEIKCRTEAWIKTGILESITGKPLFPKPRTLCLHTDHPCSMETAMLLRELLDT